MDRIIIICDIHSTYVHCNLSLEFGERVDWGLMMSLTGFDWSLEDSVGRWLSFWPIPLSLASKHPSPLNWSNSTKTNWSANLPLCFERNSLFTSLESLHLGRSGKCFDASSSLILSCGLFLKSPETCWVYFHCHSSLYIFAIPRF